ncbi:hypothetical protein P7C73_g3468, partial [Tremellales sp. Uapishka_1]
MTSTTPGQGTPLYHRQSDLGDPPSPNDHTTTLGHRLRHMFDANKYAVFVAHVTIHELGNVPQLHGDFAVRYKFRGKSPRSSEAPGPSSKPSLPNLRLDSHATQSTSSFSTSASTLSIPSPTASISSRPPTLSLPSASPVKSATIASPLSLPRNSTTASTLNKKHSEPTPLRQSMAPIFTGFQVPSPEKLSPESEKEFPLDRRHPGIDLTAPSPSIPSSPSVPFPRSGASTPIPSRSGNGVSTTTLLDPITGLSDVPTPRPRSASSQHPSSTVQSTAHSSTTSLSSFTSASTSMNPFAKRLRTASGPPSSSNSGPSIQRKGSTPSRSLRSHTCTWDFELQHLIKINLGRPSSASTSGTSTPSRVPGPPLGAGPMSESGIRLVIEQAAPPSMAGAAKDPGGAILHAVHQVEKGNLKDKTGGEKMIFGIVDVDLAAFAGKGKLTRRFLLAGSRTNATIKLTVEMKWVGGEEKWSANSSGSSQRSSQSRTPSTHSENRSRNHSDLNLVRPPTNLGYQSYEHHLLQPEETPRRNKSVTSLKIPRGFTDRSNRASARSTSRDRSATRAFAMRHHHHHANHMQIGNGAAIFPELPPEVVIESVFNPYPSTTHHPFTYLPTITNGHEGELPKDDEVLQQVMQRVEAEDGEKKAGHGNGNGRLGWGVLRMKGRDKSMRA